MAGKLRFRLNTGSQSRYLNWHASCTTKSIIDGGYDGHHESELQTK